MSLVYGHGRGRKSAHIMAFLFWEPRAAGQLSAVIDRLWYDRALTGRPWQPRYAHEDGHEPSK